MTRDYIKKYSNQVQKLDTHYNIHTVPLVVIDDFSSEIDVRVLVHKIESLIPEYLLTNIDIIYIVYTNDFVRGARTFNAMYKDGAIYISPDQDNEEDLLDDVVHEIAHSLEKQYQEEIYGDEMLEREFLAKRNTLYYLVDEPTVNKSVWQEPNYSPKFDNHLYNNIGYDKLRAVSSQLFYSPYAITSLREYWANGFENYLLGDRQRLKDLSPILYNKVINLYNQHEDI